MHIDMTGMERGMKVEESNKIINVNLISYNKFNSFNLYACEIGGICLGQIIAL